MDQMKENRLMKLRTNNKIKAFIIIQVKLNEMIK